MQVVFEGETLGEILPQIERFLKALPGDAAVQGLINLDGPLPAAVKRSPHAKGAQTTPTEVRAARAAEAPPCSRDDVARSLRAYIDKFGEATARECAPALLGAPRIADVTPENLWLAKSNIDTAIRLARPRPDCLP